MIKPCFICHKQSVVLDLTLGKWFCEDCFEEIKAVFEKHYALRLSDRSRSNWMKAALMVIEIKSMPVKKITIQ